MSTGVDVGLREGIELALVTVLVARMVPRPWSTRDRQIFVTALAVASVVGVAVAFLVHHSARQMSGPVVASVEVGMALLAVMTLSAAASGSLRDPDGRGRGAAIAPITAGAVAGATVLRETVEAVWFVTAADDARVGSTLSLLVTMAITVAACVAVLWIIGARVRPSTARVVTAVVLLLLAGGMAMYSMRAAHLAGWSDVGRTATPVLGVLADNATTPARFVLGLAGIRPGVSYAECVVGLAYVGAVAAILGRRRLALANMRRRSRATGIGWSDSIGW